MSVETPHPCDLLPLRLMRLSEDGRSRGPMVSVWPDDVVAIQQSHFDGSEQKWRTLLHLRGGSTLLVADEYEKTVCDMCEGKARRAQLGGGSQ